MQELIKIEKREIDTGLIDTVDARELYKFLEVKSDFSHWIKGRILKFGFTQHIDYIDVKKNGQYNQVDRIDYFITVGMAKELSMVENNTIGHKARRYFVDCEKKLKEMSVSNPPLLPDFSDPIAAARAWADAKESELKVKIELKEAQPKIEFAEKVEISVDSISVAKFANMLTKGGYKIGQNNLFKWFYENKYLIKSDRPYQKTLDNKWVEIEKIAYEDNSENERTCHKVLITGKGQIYFTNILKKTKAVELGQTEF